MEPETGIEPVACFITGKPLYQLSYCGAMLERRPFDATFLLLLLMNGLVSMRFL